MKEAGQRRAWTDIRRGVFTPEPLNDADEHWIEVTEHSELMCDTCKYLIYGDPRMDTITENRSSCLNLREQLDKIRNLWHLKSSVWTNLHKMPESPPDFSMSTTTALIGENFMQNET